MGPYVTFGQCGSVIVCQRRNALSRHSSSHSGSLFLAEMMRTVSSDNPGGMVSASMSVSKPAWYSLLISDSIELLIVVVGNRESGVGNRGGHRERCRLAIEAARSMAATSRDPPIIASRLQLPALWLVYRI